ncbi:hypothetical protein [Gemmatimonas sp.]|jgi:hypothetical protein|uniref:hypothetical protein n=1 Tax=Gemmatimonas sp. TaxID=1962908 RepID=UPI0022C8AB25|nr:hypothetical protein [Gemmatimonas sp.]MCZ8204376.1 hypothetical protein [Gemmatimonas sp.]
MSDHRRPMRVVALRLWDATAHHTGTPDDVLAICEALLAQLDARLRRWIGAEGYGSLLSRSVAETLATHPVLATIPNLLNDETETSVDVTAESLAQREACIALLVTMMRQLGRIVGESMAIRLIEQSGTPGARGVAGPRHNDLSS